MELGIVSRKTPRLTLDEARDLAKVFGEMDYKRSLLLLVFYTAHSRYDVMTSMDELPKKARVPRTSLYRIVKKLEETGYVYSTTRTQKTRSDTTVPVYQLTIKGILAAWIFGYALLIDPKTPSDLLEKLKVEKIIENFESASSWNLYLKFLRWQRDRGNDLSRAKIHVLEFLVAYFLFLLQRLDDFSDNDLNFMMSILWKELQQFGFNIPQPEPAKARKILSGWNTIMQSIEAGVIERGMRRTE